MATVVCWSSKTFQLWWYKRYMGSSYPQWLLQLSRSSWRVGSDAFRFAKRLKDSGRSSTLETSFDIEFLTAFEKGEQVAHVFVVETRGCSRSRDGCCPSLRWTAKHDDLSACYSNGEEPAGSILNKLDHRGVTRGPNLHHPRFRRGCFCALCDQRHAHLDVEWCLFFDSSRCRLRA